MSNFLENMQLIKSNLRLHKKKSRLPGIYQRN